MSVHESAAAVVLCGGRSARMGTDKSELLIEGESFLNRICRMIERDFDVTVAVAAQDQQLTKIPPSVCVVRDHLPHAGPLAGLLSGLEYIRNRHPEIQRCWVGSCDTPFVNRLVIRHLITTPGDWEAVVVQQGDRLQPLAAVYRMTVLETARRLVDSGERRLSQLPLQRRCHIVDAETLREYDPQLAFLRNVNTPEDYQRYVVDP